jgi:hypothetical protein
MVAGGAESMSYLPFGGSKLTINPWLMLTEHEPTNTVAIGRDIAESMVAAGQYVV